MKKLYEEEDIREIACAIRAKCGSDQSYKVCDMAKAIEEISSGGEVLTPRLGFVIEELDELGYITSGRWYGTWMGVDDYAFCNNKQGTYGSITGAYTYLTNVRFNGYVDNIGEGAFYGCKNLALTSLPEPKDGYVLSIGSYAFFNCEKLALTHLPPIMHEINDYAFYGCKNITLTSLPQGVTAIGDYAFYRCEKLALTSLPQGVTEIGWNAFYNCTNLALTSLPQGVAKIEFGAFQGCTGLTSITFKGTPSSISSSAFTGCTNLTTINVPWAQGAVAGAPWGATNATINYNYTE